MPELLRSLAARLREYVGNRRHARRFNVRLTVAISLWEINQGKTIALKTMPVPGVTSDISCDGMGLIVPSIRVGEHYLMADQRLLRVVVKAPDGDLTVDCTPVRYERLEEGDTETGYLLGTAIKEIPEEYRKRWDALLKRVERPGDGVK